MERSKETVHAARNDRPGPDGGQHGAPAAHAAATSASCIDVHPDAGEGAGRGGRDGAVVARRLREEAGQAAGHLADGARRRRRHDPRATSLPLLEAGDIVIDGGNSYYVDDIRRAEELTARGIHYVDVGTSGGVWGLERGYCLMIGGEDAGGAAPRPDLRDARARRRGGSRAPRGASRLGGTAEQGYLHCGPNGAGHFVKMVHNGIEYGIMAAYAEGLNILRHANVGKQTHEIDAETTPLRDPEHYQYDLNLRDIAEVWRRGSVIASWLLDLTAAALVEDPELADFAGRVSDSGEGRWTIKAAIDEAVPAPVLTTALYERFTSRGEADFADKLLSAMRFQFGGHVEKAAAK